MSVLSTGRGRWWVVLLALAWLAGCGNKTEAQDRPKVEVSDDPSDEEVGEGPKVEEAVEVESSGLPPVNLDAGDKALARKLNKEGLGFHRKGDYQKAIERFEAAVRADPGHILARYNLACATSLSGNGRRAVAILADLEASGCEQCVHQLGFARTDKDFTAIWSDPAFLKVTGQGGGSKSSQTSAPVSEMVEIPKGEFWMGKDEDEHGLVEHFYSFPRRKVMLDGYWIDKYEVTVDEYRKCVDARKCTPPEDGCNWKEKGRGKHPINCVSWSQATAYCKWAGKRLPTEAEWEKAARGTDERTYPWGEGEPSCDLVVMYDESDEGDCSREGTREVGSKPSGASPYGVQDMSGNVAEWVQDWFTVPREKYAPVKNPVQNSQKREVRLSFGEEVQDYWWYTERHVIRGGAWNHRLGGGYTQGYAAWARLDKNFIAFSDFDEGEPEVHPGTGFRCARSSK